MEFNVATQFVMSAVGCGKFRHLCVEFAQADFPDPEFIFNEAQRGDPIIVCQRVPCTGVYIRKEKKTSIYLSYCYIIIALLSSPYRLESNNELLI